MSKVRVSSRSAPFAGHFARLQASPWLRRGSYVGVGLAVFVLGATYLNLRYPPDMPSFMVIGSGWVASGEPTSLRVRARTIDARSAVKVTVSRIELGGREIAFQQAGGDPVTVSFRVPVANGAGQTDRLQLTVTAGERTETVPVPVEVLTGDTTPDTVPTPPPKLMATDKAFRLSLIPEGPGVVARLDNQIFVKVRTPSGEPVSGATVTIAHSSFRGGKIVLTTDASGLGAFDIDADRPSYTLKMKVARGDAEAEFEETISPGGRQMLLRTAEAVLRPGEIEQVEIVTWRQGVPVFCDLRHGSVWLWSREIDLQASGHRVDAGPLAPGRYDLQCYFHPHTPGSTWGSLPIVVGDGDPLVLLAARVRQAEVVNPGALELPGTTRSDLAAGYFLALLNAPPVMPTLLVNTRDADDAGREAAWTSKKRVVLIVLGGVFVLVLLLVFELILGNILSQRDRMRAYAAELAADGDGDGDELDDLVMAAHKERDSLVRTRGIVLVVLVGGTLIANLIAFILLMVLIR